MKEPLHVYVKRLRQARGKWFSQNKLAELAGLAPSTIHRLEKGEHQPEVPTLQAIAPHLGVQADDLLRRAGYTDEHGHWLGATPEVPPDPFAVIAQQLANLGYPEPRRQIIIDWIREMRPVAPSTESPGDPSAIRPSPDDTGGSASRA